LSSSSGFASGSFVVDAGIAAALQSSSGTIRIGSQAFPGGEIGGKVILIEQTPGPVPGPVPGTVPGTVPEPATYVTVLIGFVLLGSGQSLRRAD
jgi:hypothetical protein